jgi:protein ImuB
MLWLCIHFPQLAVELLQPDKTAPWAITQHQGQQRWIIAATDAARAAGVVANMTAPVALTRVPNLQLIERDLSQERSALQSFACLAYQWSSMVCIDSDRWIVGIEIAGSLRYFGSPETLSARAVQAANQLGYSVQLGMAPTWEGAMLFACAHPPAQASAMKSFLQTLLQYPVTELQVSKKIAHNLIQSGLKSIRAVLQLPRAALTRRFGPEFSSYLQRLLGEQADIPPLFKMPERYQRDLTCINTVDSVEAVSFPLQRLVQELTHYLVSRDVAVESFMILLLHRQQPASRLDLQFTSAQRDPVAIFEQLRLQLERLHLPEPIIQVSVIAEKFVAADTQQKQLFFSADTQLADWHAVLDRLRARLGVASIRSLSLVNDHRPERAWSTTISPHSKMQQAITAQRPLWLLNPQQLATPPQITGHPERIEAGWWEGCDDTRDYYLATSSQGATWWVYWDRSKRQWFLHGIWA